MLQGIPVKSDSQGSITDDDPVSHRQHPNAVENGPLQRGRDAVDLVGSEIGAQDVDSLESSAATIAWHEHTRTLRCREERQAVVQRGRCPGKDATQGHQPDPRQWCLRQRIDAPAYAKDGTRGDRSNEFVSADSALPKVAPVGHAAAIAHEFHDAHPATLDADGTARHGAGRFCGRATPQSHLWMAL
jgi:hypothetical protein